MQRATTGDLPSRFHVQGQGLLLFLFIPGVLYLFVRQPEPLGWSLGLGVVLMVGHRFLARPYMVRVALHKCLWSNRRLVDDARAVEIHHRGGVQPARCLERHVAGLRRFFAFVHRIRGLLAFAIFGPLLLLLATSALVAAGVEPPIPLDTVTACFQLVIGSAVNLAALGPFVPVAEATDETPMRVTFPVHNFFLLGVSNLLWIFRVMGMIWIVTGFRVLFA
ncbi:MAG: hypothetical protein AAGE94_14715 [Acidobacteriota bacterium]